MTPGMFIEPDASLAALDDPNARLGIPVRSGFKAAPASLQLLGRNRIFDAIQDRCAALALPYEDQCSPQYYYDLVSTLRDFAGEFDRVVEVGVYMGGATSMFAGCVERFDFDLDLVDITKVNLFYSYERARRLFPESAGRIRLFHGTLPQYVQNVLLYEEARAVVHHDGAHDFEQVVKDFASLFYAQEKVHAVIAQDTHLRGVPPFLNFVDKAVEAVFGRDAAMAPIGACYPDGLPMTNPNRFEGNYFLGGVSEGQVLPMTLNRFHYPHPAIPLSAFVQPSERPKPVPYAGDVAAGVRAAA